LRAAIKSRHTRVVSLSKHIANCALPALLSHPRKRCEPTHLLRNPILTSDQPRGSMECPRRRILNALRRALRVRRCSTVFIFCVTPHSFGFSQFLLFN
jgi:hypothetical protein